MHPSIALSLIQTALPHQPEKWADIGAGTGLFTEVMRDHLPAGSTVYALDKSPHMLWRIQQRPEVPIQVVEGDFNREMELPQLDGILMANALHYAEDSEAALRNVLQYLKPQGKLIMIEYDTPRARPPWVPYPVPFSKLATLAQALSLTTPEKMHQVPSAYGHDAIYAARLKKES